MDIEQEKQVISNSSAIFLVIQGENVRIGRTLARTMLFSKHGWVIDTGNSRIVKLVHPTIS
jgi:hypothetical protein